MPQAEGQTGRLCTGRRGTVVYRGLTIDPVSGRVHYDGMQSEQRDPDDLELYVTPAPPGEGALLVRMSPQIADEVRALLDENGLDHSHAAEFSSGAELALESVRVVGAAGGLAALASVINTVIRRHDGKRVLIERDQFEASGYSEKAVERLLAQRVEEQEQSETEWGPHQGPTSTGTAQ